jgi:hypothetical protein
MKMFSVEGNRQTSAERSQKSVGFHLMREDGFSHNGNTHTVFVTTEDRGLDITESWFFLCKRHSDLGSFCPGIPCLSRIFWGLLCS